MRKLWLFGVALWLSFNAVASAEDIPGTTTGSPVGEDRASGRAELEKVVRKFPGAAYSIKIGEPAVVGANLQMKTVKIRIPVDIVWDRAFIRELMETMKRASEISLEHHDLLVANQRFKDLTPEGRFPNIFCFTANSSLTHLAPEFCGLLSEPSAGGGNSPALAKFMRLMHGGSEVQAKLRIAMKDELDRPMKVFYSDLDSDSYHRQKLDHINLDGTIAMNALGFGAQNGNLPNGIDGPYGKIILLQGKYYLDVDTELKEDIFRKVRSIDATMEAAESI